jgi:hypothetical protein
MYNIFYWIYDYLFVNHTIDEQDDMRLADLALISYYKKRFEIKNKT